MSEAYWQAKIWGLLHDPALKALHDNTGGGGNSFWQDLPAMQAWVTNNWNPETSPNKILQHLQLADYITAASDRSAIGSLTSRLSYNDKGLEISHLLSGEKLTLKLEQHQEFLTNRLSFLQAKERELSQAISETAHQDIKRLFWWLWRCFPEATCQAFNTDSLLLIPADTKFPDASLWSHVSLTAAMAGALVGYDLTTEDIPKNWESDQSLSHAYLTIFTFTPIQEVIKASRKMRNFWAGSWLLHYLSAKVCWQLAQQYGPDCFIYPNLYQQPLIDHWLLQTYPEFENWIKQPRDRQLLTAGFPNVLVLVLPKDKVAAAMQTAKSNLLKEWQDIGKLVFTELQNNRHWMEGLSLEHKTWQGWLQAQWQTYWTAVPIGKEGQPLQSREIYQQDATGKEVYQENEEANCSWRNAQNKAYDLTEKKAKSFNEELEFLSQAAKLRWQQERKHPASANVGSWWSHIFDQTRFALATVKNARTWSIPTAFGPRSTVSGMGPAIHPDNHNNKQDWVTEGDTRQLWQRQAGLFDGIEELNATETLKRGLHLILHQLLKLEQENESIYACYPDLTAGVAGYLKVKAEDKKYFAQVCQEIFNQHPWTEKVIKDMRNKWGIPWADSKPQKYHPRLLNTGWLIEDAETEELKQLYAQLEGETDEKITFGKPKELMLKKLPKLFSNTTPAIIRLTGIFWPPGMGMVWASGCKEPDLNLTATI